MLDQLLLDHRMTVEELPGALARGGIVIDIRTQCQRTREGTLPGALAIGINVVEQKLDPRSTSCISLARERIGAWILVCSSGERADAVAVDLRLGGLRQVMSLAGGFRALRATSLTVAARTSHYEQSVAMVLCA
ncbi:rhodanese-like domain-containing protein [Nocardia sp. IFM 10818]